MPRSGGSGIQILKLKSIWSGIRGENGYNTEWGRVDFMPSPKEIGMNRRNKLKNFAD